MAKKSNPKYIKENQEFLVSLESQDGVTMLPKGVLYTIQSSGEGKTKPTPQSIVSVHYEGRLIDGTIFDTTKGGYPETFRLREVIEGWQIALQEMKAGDSWTIYIPCELGYGSRRCGNIPANSTLIFEVELLSVN